MERLAALSTGTKLMLASSTLLFLDLFLTWQKVPQEYGRRFDVTDNLDAWDGWGLLLGLATLSLIALLVLRETNVELSPDVPWSRIALGIAGLVLFVTVVKNALDAHSAWASYAGILLAAVCVAGAWLDRDRAQPERERPFGEKWKPRVRANSAADPAQAPDHRSDESPAAEPSARW
jgi:hypothetical protein